MKKHQLKLIVILFLSFLLLASLKRPPGADLVSSLPPPSNIINFHLLPDLQISPLSHAYIVPESEGKRTLRFPTVFNNIGQGPLELTGESDEKAEKTEVTQHIYQANGIKTTKHVGYFVFHPPHDHWHFENFVESQLLNLKENGDPDKVVATTGKITFCIRDDKPIPEDIPGKPKEAVYPRCQPFVQGISVGWSDEYTDQLPGQELDISDVEDGIYAFRTIADPENRIVEENEMNNVTISYIRIQGDQVNLVSEP